MKIKALLEQVLLKEQDIFIIEEGIEESFKEIFVPEYVEFEVLDEDIDEEWIPLKIGMEFHLLLQVIRFYLLYDDY